MWHFYPVIQLRDKKLGHLILIKELMTEFFHALFNLYTNTSLIYFVIDAEGRYHHEMATEIYGTDSENCIKNSKRSLQVKNENGFTVCRKHDTFLRLTKFRAKGPFRILKVLYVLTI